MIKKFAAGALATTLLAGCQSIFGHHAELDVRPVGAAPATNAQMSLGEGRAALMRGEIGAAIVALRLAAETPDAATMAAAHNGLGVAYAMLGRGDVAERYFQRAILEMPTEAKYSANLAKFYAANEAKLAVAPASPAPVPESEAAPVSLESQFDAALASPRRALAISPQAEEPRMTRLSTGEVAIRTESPAPAGLIRRASPSGYPVRIELSSIAAR